MADRKHWETHKRNVWEKINETSRHCIDGNESCSGTMKTLGITLWKFASKSSSRKWRVLLNVDSPIHRRLGDLGSWSQIRKVENGNSMAFPLTMWERSERNPARSTTEPSSGCRPRITSLGQHRKSRLSFNNESPSRAPRIRLFYTAYLSTMSWSLREIRDHPAQTENISSEMASANDSRFCSGIFIVASSRSRYRGDQTDNKARCFVSLRVPVSAARWTGPCFFLRGPWRQVDDRLARLSTRRTPSRYGRFRRFQAS